MLRVALVHERLLLVQKLLLEFPLAQLGKLGFSISNSLCASLLDLFDALFSLHSVVLRAEQGLVLLLLLTNSLNCLFVLFARSLWIISLVEVGESLLGFCDILSQDVVDVVVLLLLLRLDVALPSLLEPLVIQNSLELLLLFTGELVL